MKFTIEPMKIPLDIIIEKRVISYPGYAFMDKLGHCIIIVYGEKHKKDMIKFLSE
jgi:hypothetical protein